MTFQCSKKKRKKSQQFFLFCMQRLYQTSKRIFDEKRNSTSVSEGTVKVLLKFLFYIFVVEKLYTKNLTVIFSLSIAQILKSRIISNIQFMVCFGMQKIIESPKY